MSTQLTATLLRAGFAFVSAEKFRAALDERAMRHYPNSLPFAQGMEQNLAAALSPSLPPYGVGEELGHGHRNDLLNWRPFADSWNNLSVDAYMADGGRYRRRRFGAFAVSATRIVRKPHQPHYQSRDYNPLNGGVERWFEPIADDIGAHPILHACLRLCRSIFDSLTPNPPSDWHCEVHQFRIEARADEQGLPTPEGMHRDGVDWVLVLLIARENIAEGVTAIHDLAQQPLGSFTLTHPLDAAFVDDSRVYHGVTAVQPLDPSRPAYRDVLVATFRRP